MPKSVSRVPFDERCATGKTHFSRLCSGTFQPVEEL
jgi:hypothetical protein